MICVCNKCEEKFEGEFAVQNCKKHEAPHRYEETPARLKGINTYTSYHCELLLNILFLNYRCQDYL